VGKKARGGQILKRTASATGRKRGGGGPVEALTAKNPAEEGTE